MRKLCLSQKSRLRFIKYTTVLGCCLLLVPNGLFWYWGNLAVYCMSYFVSVKDAPEGVESSWIFSLFIIFWTVGILSSGIVSRKFGRKVTILVGMLIFDLGIFFGYLTVQHSLAALTVSMGAVTGMGTGVMDGSALQIVIEWSNNEVGRFTAALQGSLSIGALVINQLVTLYINPDNYVPTYTLGPTKYFTAKKVLDKVPSMFLVIGGLSVSLHLIGVFIIRERNTIKIEHDTATEQTSLNDRIRKESYHSEKTSQNENFEETNGSNSYHNTITIDGTYTNTENINNKTDIPDNNIGNTTDHEKDSNTVTKTDNIKISDLVNAETRDYNILEMLKCKSFYVLWLTFFFCSMPLLLIGNYYKMFGQVWIKDDHFMSDLATTMAVASAVMSSIWGFAMDAFGVKRCKIAFITCIIMVLLWYYFTPMVNRWLFFATSVLFMCVSGPTFGCFTSVTALLYGKTNMSTNFGIMMTSQMLFHIMSPFFMGRLLTNLGWFVTFTGTGVILLLTLVLTILFVPDI